MVGRRSDHHLQEAQKKLEMGKSLGRFYSKIWTVDWGLEKEGRSNGVSGDAV